MQLDSEQQAAVAVQENVVVEAGAGSGKTSVLTARYLRLVVEEKVHVAEILALTFTRKAAAEMYRRIYEAISAAAAEHPHLLSELEQFDTAQISTLDSFCAQIARNGCASYGVAPTFTTDERRLAELCDRISLEFLLEHQLDAALQPLLEAVGFADIWKKLLAPIAREEVLIARPPSFSQMAGTQRGFVEAELVRTLERSRRLVEEILEIDPEHASCIASGHQQLCRTPPPEPGSPSGEIAEWSDLPRALSLRCGSSKKAEVLQYKDRVNQLRELAGSLKTLAASEAAWPRTQSLLALLDRFAATVLEHKRASGLLSYHDVVVMAVEVLRADAQLRRHYRDRFRAIMIDEFQDNNEIQKELLFLLAENRATGSGLDPSKLFFVGDEKQSIYRFRGADVRVIKRLASDLAGEAIRLRHNYRSEPGLVRFFNHLFSHVMANAERDDEARFESLESREASAGVTASVELWCVEKQDEREIELLSADDSEAYHIARRIAEAVENHATIVSDGGHARPARYSDFAILMRSSGNQIAYERMLRLHGVPYRTDSVRTLFLDAPASDIYCALQLLLYPDDRVAYAGLLRSPLVGLSDAATIRVLASGEPPFAAAKLPQERDRQRYEIGALRFAELGELCGNREPSDLIFHIWYRWGYRYLILRRPDLHTYLEYYDYLMELARTYADEGLPRFLDEVRRRLGANERLEEIEADNDNRAGVQLMTIHKAKGLEFPVVFVANASNQGRRSHAAEAPYHRSQRFGVVINNAAPREDRLTVGSVNAIFALELEEEKRATAAELKRLLYVALTRAQSHLIITGARGSRVAEGSFLDLIATPFARAVEELADDPGIRIQERALSRVPAELLRRTPRAATARDVGSIAKQYGRLPLIRRPALPREFTVTEIAAESESAEAASRPQGAPSGSGALDIDTLLDEHALHTWFGDFCHHRCGQLLRTGEIDPVESGRLPRALRLQLPEAARLYAAGDALALGFARSELFSSLRQTAKQPRKVFIEEQLLTSHTVDGQAYWLRGKPDIVAVDDSQVMLVDLKTDARIEPGRHELQVELYRRALAAYYERPVACSLFYLRFGRAVTIDPRLDEEAIGRAIRASAESR